MMATHTCDYAKTYLIVFFDRIGFPQEIENRTTI